MPLMSADVRIALTEPPYLESFRATLDAVARERRFLALLELPRWNASKSSSRAFLSVAVFSISRCMVPTRLWAGATSTDITPKVTDTAVSKAWGCYLNIEDAALARGLGVPQSMQLA
jgi:hypothetical protein